MDEFGIDSNYGYADYTTASLEAQGIADNAWNAGDMDAYNHWSSVSWDSWNTGTDLYVSGADSYGFDSPSTSEGYFPSADTSWAEPATTLDTPWGTDLTWATTDSSYAPLDTTSSWATTDTTYSPVDTSASWTDTSVSSYDYSSSEY